MSRRGGSSSAASGPAGRSNYGRLRGSTLVLCKRFRINIVSDGVVIFFDEGESRAAWECTVRTRCWPRLAFLSVVEERENRLVTLFAGDGRVEGYGDLRGTETLDCQDRWGFPSLQEVARTTESQSGLRPNRGDPRGGEVAEASPRGRDGPAQATDSSLTAVPTA